MNIYAIIAMTSSCLLVGQMVRTLRQVSRLLARADVEGTRTLEALTAALVAATSAIAAIEEAVPDVRHLLGAGQTAVRHMDVIEEARKASTAVTKFCVFKRRPAILVSPTHSDNPGDSEPLAKCAIVAVEELSNGGRLAAQAVPDVQHLRTALLDVSETVSCAEDLGIAAMGASCDHDAEFWIARDTHVE